MTMTDMRNDYCSSRSSQIGSHSSRGESVPESGPEQRLQRTAIGGGKLNSGYNAQQLAEVRGATQRLQRTAIGGGKGSDYRLQRTAIGGGKRLQRTAIGGGKRSDSGYNAQQLAEVSDYN